MSFNSWKAKTTQAPLTTPACRPGRVSCDKFFRYTWWITFFHFFVWLLVLAFLFTRTIHKFRAGLVGLLATVTVLLMDTANTYLYFKDVPAPAGDSEWSNGCTVLSCS